MRRVPFPFINLEGRNHAICNFRLFPRPSDREYPGAVACTTPIEVRDLESPSEFGHFRPVEDGFDDGEAPAPWRRSRSAWIDRTDREWRPTLSRRREVLTIARVARPRDRRPSCHSIF
jgi:hypothetical protein